jgi:putative hydrolase of the HAD superfamily
MSADRSGPAVLSRLMTTLVIWDGDDTLWFVEQLYDEARTAVASIVAALGLDPARWEQLQLAIDVGNVASMGLSQERFPTSCVQALEAVAHESGDSLPTETCQHVRDAAAQVFDRVAPLAEGVNEVLERVSTQTQMVLLTKGDVAVQTKRIADSGLARYFRSAHIVPEKDPSTYSAVAAMAGVPTEECWSVGNSLPSDVNAALEAGMSAIWIDAHVWEHERRQTDIVPGRVHRADSLKEAGVLLIDAIRIDA